MSIFIIFLVLYYVKLKVVLIASLDVFISNLTVLLIAYTRGEWGTPLDEWELAVAGLNLPTISSVSDISVDGNQTFSFSEPIEFDLVHAKDEEMEPAELKTRGECELIHFKSVIDPSMRQPRDWCHTRFAGRVSDFINI